jgi:16S rRNA (uracil1498-N3)-methyltransferase
MAERFYVPAVGSDDTVVLTGDEAHHLARVRRIRRGEHVSLFDGSGIECDAVVREIGRGEVVLNVESRQRVDRELPFPLTLGCSPAKGDRLRWLIEKATELGVSRFVPILTERASEQARGIRSEKTGRWVIEACKQCGRNVLMEVSDAVAWLDFLSSNTSQTARLIAAPTGMSPGTLGGLSLQNGVVIAVGPEGGFTAGELDAALGLGWQPISLGPRTLRVETAALAMVASVTAFWPFPNHTHSGAE